MHAVLREAYSMDEKINMSKQMATALGQSAVRVFEPRSCHQKSLTDGVFGSQPYLLLSSRQKEAPELFGKSSTTVMPARGG